LIDALPGSLPKAAAHLHGNLAVAVDHEKRQGRRRSRPHEKPRPRACHGRD
jgi:hypothetical protein